MKFRKYPVLLLVCFWSGGAAAAEDANDAAEKDALKRKTEFARQLDSRAARLGDRTPEYFAVARRGLDLYDHLERRRGGAMDISEIDLNRIDPSPGEPDRTPTGQTITTRRLGAVAAARLTADEKIVGGTKVGPGVAEEVVYLSGNNYSCTGVALDATTILTAAHCVCDLKLSVSAGGDKRATITHDIAANVTRRYDIDYTKTRFHPSGFSCSSFSGSISNGQSDLALLRLVSPATMTVPQIRLATSDQVDAAVPSGFSGGASFILYGFGCTTPDQSLGPFVRCFGQGGRKVLGFIYTADWWAGTREFELRSNAADPVDTCAGDSGGPVMLIDKTGGSVTYRLAGITSRALDPDGRCEAGGIYTNVAQDNVLKWLADENVVIVH